MRSSSRRDFAEVISASVVSMSSRAISPSSGSFSRDLASCRFFSSWEIWASKLKISRMITARRLFAAKSGLL